MHLALSGASQEWTRKGRGMYQIPGFFYSQCMGRGCAVGWAQLTFIVPCGWGNSVERCSNVWRRVMMKWPRYKALLLVLPAPLPSAVGRIDEHGPVRRRWARLHTHRFVLCAAVLQTIAWLPLICCNPSKAIFSQRLAHVLYCSERVGLWGAGCRSSEGGESLNTAVGLARGS